MDITNKNVKNIINSKILLQQYVDIISREFTNLSILQLSNLLKNRYNIVGLPSNEDINNLFKNYRQNDKGIDGKLFEYTLFGVSPNCDSNPDLIELQMDIKCCKFQKLKKCGNMNSKERITITNVGTTENYASFKEILTHDKIEDTKYYSKIQKGLLVIKLYKKNVTLQDYLDEKIIKIVQYDIEKLDKNVIDILKDDYVKIRKRVQYEDVSQKGQTYLHICPHGSKGDNTRALAFTPKFVTEIVYQNLLKEFPDKNYGEIKICKGNSISINSLYLEKKKNKKKKFDVFNDPKMKSTNPTKSGRLHRKKWISIKLGLASR